MQTANENGKVKTIKMTEKIVAINTTALEAFDCWFDGGAWSEILIKKNVNLEIEITL